MKRIKFWQNLVDKIQSGSKTSTWRLFDDKNFQVGDKLEFTVTETGEKFAEAEIVKVTEKTMGEITEDDFDGHETYSSRDEMLEVYRGYYGEKVDWDTVVKMIDFKLIPKP